MKINALSPKLGICETHDTAYVDGEQMEGGCWDSGKIVGVGRTLRRYCKMR
jgi:hypothetical protein